MKLSRPGTCHLSHVLGAPQGVHELVQEVGRKLGSLDAGQQALPQGQALRVLPPRQLWIYLCTT